MTFFLGVEIALGLRKGLPLRPGVMCATLRKGLVRHRLRSKLVDEPTSIIPEPLRTQGVCRIGP
jgi:hypothetical protein